MIIVAEKSVNLSGLVTYVHGLGHEVDVSEGTETVVVGIKGDTRRLREDQFSLLPGVREVRRISTKYKLVSKQFHPQHIVRIGELEVNGDRPIIIAGPCAIETQEQAMRTYEEIADVSDIFRGMLWKPRTSPYDFQGLREKGIPILEEVKRRFGKPIVQEILDPRHLDVLHPITDVYQIGMRNMFNYELLREVGKAGKPVILKRNFAARLEEWLLAAEYVANEGNMDVILCERGVLTSFTGDYTRNTPDLAVIRAARKKSCLPVIFDPSHSTGDAEEVVPTSIAALSMGAQGLEIDVMPRGYDRRLLQVDGKQAITRDELDKIVKAAKTYHEK